MIRFLLLFCCCCIYLSVPAQESTGLIRESISVHTDRQLYISGETIWLKVYVRDASGHLSPFSKVAYAELLDPESSPIAQVKLPLSGGLGAGSISLPAILDNGRYQLRIYTQALRNFGEAHFSKTPLYILRPGQALPPPVAVEPAATTSSDHAAAKGAGNLQIELALEQTQYAQRELVSLKIRTKNPDGSPLAAQLSVSVALSTPSDAPVFTGTRAISSDEANSSPGYLPEDKGMLFNGRLIQPGTQTGWANKIVYLSFPNKNGLLLAQRTDSLGQFTLLLPKVFGLREAIVQSEPGLEPAPAFELSNPFHPSTARQAETFALPESWVSNANTALVNAQITSGYQRFSLPPHFIADSTFVGLPFFGEPELRFNLDDYTRFPIPEFFYEVVPEVRVGGRYGAERLSLLNEWELPTGPTPPLLLVDGVPVFDQQVFIKINNKLIASTEIVTDPYWLNPQVFDGIIQLTSFEGDARCFRLPESAMRFSYTALLPEQQFDAPNYQLLDPGSKPDFRNTLHWDPRVTTNSDGEAEIQFFTSDALGSYQIQVAGVGTNGIAGSQSVMLEVGKREE